MKEYVKKLYLYICTHTYIYIYIYIYIKNYKLTPNRNVKPDKEKICNSKKYIEMCIKIFKNIYIQTLNHKNVQKCMQKNIHLKL